MLANFRPHVLPVVQQHAEETAFLRNVRSVLVAAPHVKLLHLRRLDDRLAAHLDGLAVAGEFGWKLRTGAYQLVLTGQDLLKRLALLVPRPYVHLVRYHGVFAPRSRWRPWIVPKAPAQTTAVDACCPSS
jgi:hypothetical protein